MIDTKYILEYRFNHLDGPEWVHEKTFNDQYDALHAYHKHTDTYRHADCRVRRVRTVEEESVVGSYIAFRQEGDNE